MENMVMSQTDFWRSKRVLITGHSGFKGSWLTQWLVMLGAEVCGFSLEPPTEPNLFSTLNLAKDIDHRVGDIRNSDSLATTIREFKPEIIFHLAAQPLVRLSYQEPRLTYETNVMGTLNLYEAIRTCDSVNVVVSITTDKCYENKEWVWGYRENDPMGGYDPYSSSKGCAELLSAAYRRSFFNPEQYGKTHQVSLATARAGNVIGGGDWALDRLIPDCVRSLEKNETIVIRSPNATRPWQHVLEPLSGYLLLAKKMYEDGLLYSEGWNFGPGDDSVLSVEQIVQSTVKSWGCGEYAVASDANLHEAQLLKLDASKAKARLGWKCKFSIENAIEQTIFWYRTFSDKLPTKELTMKQINTYQEG